MTTTINIFVDHSNNVVVVHDDLDNDDDNYDESVDPNGRIWVLHWTVILL